MPDAQQLWADRLARELQQVSWLRRIAAALLLFVVLIVLAEVVPGFRRLDRQAAQARAVPRADRALQGARSVDIDRTFLHRALTLIPAHDSFAVATGPHVSVSTPLTLQALGAYAQFLLLPRRETTPAKAQWLLCFGCAPASFPRLHVVWQSGPSVLIGKLSP